MNEQDGYHVPPLSAFGNYSELHLSPNGSSVSHGLALSSWPPQITHYDEASQYFPVAGTLVSDFQEHLNVHPCMDKFMGSSLQTDPLNLSMQDDFLYQDLASRAGLLCFGQCGNMKNESQTNCFDCTFKTHEVNGNDYVIQSLGPSKPASSFHSKQCRRLPKEELNARDYQRRILVTNAIQDLEKLLPQSAKNQWEVISKSIEYVKHLELQLKELSQNRLIIETDSDPFISLKGLGFPHSPQMTLEELKDEFGDLIQENPAAAMELLQNRGLLKVPLELVKALPKTE